MNLIESKYQIINIKQNHRKLHKMYFYIKLVLLRFPKRFSKSTCQKNAENEVAKEIVVKSQFMRLQLLLVSLVYYTEG